MKNDYEIIIAPNALRIEVDFLDENLKEELISAIRTMHIERTLPEKFVILETKGFDGQAREFAATLSKRSGRAFVVCAEFDDEKKAYVVSSSLLPDMPVGMIIQE